MAYYVRAPGTCGEFIQGSIDGQSFLVTCPINRYSYALSDVMYPLPFYHCSLQPKAQEAHRIVFRTLQDANTMDINSIRFNDFSSCYEESFNTPIYVRSDIVQGKGMASSSADISVTAMATALALQKTLTLKELESICLSVEPTDAAFYPGITQFDYITGSISQHLGQCPPLKILIFDEGGGIDTVAFNQQADLQKKIEEKESIIREALDIFKEGLVAHDIRLIGQAATLSAFANQRILYKPHLYDFHEIGIAFQSVGTIIAHSGTIMGLLFPSDYNGISDCKRYIERKLPSLQFVDIVETTNEGLTYIKR